MSASFDDVEQFYEAYGLFSELVNAPENQLRFRLRPGQVLMLNNQRTLHARDAFQQDTGNRHLQLATTDMDMVDSRLRGLTSELAECEEVDSLLSREPTVQPAGG